MIIVLVAFFIAETNREEQRREEEFGSAHGSRVQCIVGTEAWRSRPPCTHSQEAGERTNTGARLSVSILLSLGPQPWDAAATLRLSSATTIHPI